MKKLSIIIPHYNDFDGLSRLAASIYGQRDCEGLWAGETEVIVVDDYSDPDIQQKVRELKKKYPFFYYENHQKKSAGTCRNIGLDHASGKYIFFADSDDYFLPEMFLNISDLLEQDNDIVFFSPEGAFADGSPACYRADKYQKLIDNYLIDKSKTNEDALRLSWNPPWSKLYRRELIEAHNIRFDEIPASNDMNFCLTAGFLAKKIEAVSTPVYCSVVRKGSLERTVSLEILSSRIYALHRYQTISRQFGNDKFAGTPLVYLCRGLAGLDFKDFLKLLKYSKKIGGLDSLNCRAFIKKLVRYFSFLSRGIKIYDPSMVVKK